MRIRLLFPAMTSAALTLFGFGAGGAQAGSFFGPSCYGADYANQYPNRAKNQFGCGPGTHCQARHPLFHRLFHRHQNAPNQEMPPNGMPGYAMPMNGMPGNVMPSPNMEAPIVQSPIVTAPIHTTSVAPAPVPAMPAVRSRIVPVPAPLPPGPAGAAPVVVDPSGKPPF